jgi:surfeit locus 1 family protein
MGFRLGNRVWAAPLWALLLAMVGVAFFLRLGMWQLGRADEKAMMAERYEQRAHMPPLDLRQVIARGRDIEDAPVRLQGRYDNTRTVFLENQTRRGRAGFHVHAVFFPAGDHIGILVNRGWVAVGADMQRLPGVPSARSTDVAGTLAIPSRFFTVGEPDYRQRPLRVARLEMDKLSNALGVELRPFVIRLDSSAADGFVREWAPAARLGVPPEKHRAYAFQWFSLAGAVIGVLVFVNLRKSDNAENE